MSKIGPSIFVEQQVSKEMVTGLFCRIIFLGEVLVNLIFARDTIVWYGSSDFFNVMSKMNM